MFHLMLSRYNYPLCSLNIQILTKCKLQTVKTKYEKENFKIAFLDTISTGKSFISATVWQFKSGCTQWLLDALENQCDKMYLWSKFNTSPAKKKCCLVSPFLPEFSLLSSCICYYNSWVSIPSCPITAKYIQFHSTKYSLFQREYRRLHRERSAALCLFPVKADSTITAAARSTLPFLNVILWCHRTGLPK
jgi:hypothetical protein